MASMFPEAETEVERLIRRHRKAKAFAHTDPEHALLEVRKVTETICTGIVSAAKVDVRAKKERPTLDEIVTAIEQRKLAPPLVAAQIRALQAAGNYGAHDQEDHRFLTAAWATVYLGQLDVVLGWYLEVRWSVRLDDRSVELSGLVSLQAIAALEDEDEGPERSKPDTIPVPGERAERRSSPRPVTEPRSAEEWLMVAARHEVRNERALAARAFDRALHFFIRRGDLQHARLVAERVTRLVPDSGEHWIQLGEVLVSAGVIQGALVALHRAAERFQSSGEQARCTEVCERIVALAPDDIGTLHALAKAYLDHGDGHRALRTISRCLPIRPREPETLRILAECFDRLGHPEKAAQVRAVAITGSTGTTP